MERESYGDEWFETFLKEISKEGMSAEALNPAIAKVIAALNQGHGIEEARTLELVRSADYLLRVQRLLQDKPDRIIGRDKSSLSESELDTLIEKVTKEIIGREKRTEIGVTLH